MTRHEAEKEMVRLLMAHQKWHEDNKLPEKKVNNIIEADATPEEWSRWKSEHDYSESSIARFGALLAANPAFGPVMVCWRVSIHGGNPVDVARLKEQVDGEPLEFRNLLRGTGGLQNTVGGFVEKLEEEGYILGGCGGGVCGWDYSVLCNNMQAGVLCELLYEKFAKAIETGMMTVLKWPEEPQLPGLLNDRDALDWIKENGEPE